MMKPIQSFKRLTFKPNETIFNEGDAGLATYMITRGKVRLRRDAEGSNPQTLAEAGPGETIGELALFDDRPRMAQALTVTTTEVIEISYEEFHKRLDDMDSIMKGIVLLMIKRVRQFTDEVMDGRSDSG